MDFKVIAICKRPIYDMGFEIFGEALSVEIFSMEYEETSIEEACLLE